MGTVPAIMLDRLAAARRAGVPFGDAWPVALDAALAASPARDRSGWADALSGTVGAWRRAFDREPAGRTERALVAVAEGCVATDSNVGTPMLVDDAAYLRERRAA